jgi:hypothetical protein
MPHATAYGGVLDPALFKDTTLPMFILMSELSIGTVGDHLNLSMRMKGPDSSRRKGIVIQNTQGAEVHVFTVMILVEGEMPATKEGTILD